MSDMPKRLPVAEQIRKGLEESLRYLTGEITLKTTVVELPDPPPEVRADELTELRLDSRMSQAVFARLLNVSTKTVQSWEQGTRKPSQAALRLIQVLREDPEGLLRIAGMSGAGTAANVPQRGKARAKPSSRPAAKEQSV